MRQPPQIQFLADGKRLHLSDGPIDLVIEAFGTPDFVSAAHRAATHRFITILDELCSELSLLRQPMRAGSTLPNGVVAQCMARAVAPYAERCFITPMAAVAGAVAEEVLRAMTGAASFSRAYVNNGGDIAFYLAPNEQFVVGMIERPDRASLCGTATLRYDQPTRGIATSGWRGRSFSLGIADAVTVLSSTASQADAAATIIANAVDLPSHAGIIRESACNLAPDNDLGDIPVTCFVPPLTESQINQAIASGANLAEELRTAGLINSAALCLQGQVRIIGAQRDLDRKVDRLPAIHSPFRSPLHA
jgi:uncharacterized protein